MPLLVGSLFTAAPGFPTILSGQETSKMSPSFNHGHLDPHTLLIYRSHPFPNLWTLPSSSTASSSSKFVVRPPHPQALFLELFPNSGLETLSLLSRRYPVHQSRLAHLTLPSSLRPVHDMSLANRTVSEAPNFSLPSAKVGRLALKLNS